MQIDILQLGLHSKVVIMPASLIPLVVIMTCIYHCTAEYEMHKLKKQF